MFSYEVTRWETRSNGASYKKIHGECLSTDSKPTAGIINGSDVIEMDTSKLYFFDEAGTAWIEWEG